jgi:hypothetical protein
VGNKKNVERECAPHRALIFPVRERSPAGLPQAGNEFADDAAARIQSPDDAVQRVGVMPVPFFRYACGTLLNLIQAHPLSAAESRLEAPPSGHSGIGGIRGIDAPERCIGERPLPGVEAIAVVNKGDAVLARAWGTMEYALPPIAVACPLVEHENACEIAQVGNFAEVAFRQVVNNGGQLLWLGDEA